MEHAILGEIPCLGRQLGGKEGEFLKASCFSVIVLTCRLVTKSYERLMGNRRGSSSGIVTEATAAVVFATAIVAARRRFGGNVAGVIKADCRYHSWRP